MFEKIQPAPPDPIFGLNEAYRSDPSPKKVNLGAGVYQDESGQTPVLEVVKEAERRLAEGEQTKSYLPIDGLADYNRLVRLLILGANHPAIKEGRSVTLQAPGGTGALRLFAELWRTEWPSSPVWMSDPTWANHPAIFGAAKIAMRTYPYLDASSGSLRYEEMLAALGEAERGDLVLLHGVCHNPTGVDPTLEQWQGIAKVLAERGALALVDFAYQGFADGLEEDVAGIRLLAGELPEMAICSSFSKTLGLYRERVGALTLVTTTPEAARAVGSQAKRQARVLYSNPPSHGGSVAATVLGDRELRERWYSELAAMRERIAGVRRMLVSELDRRDIRLRENGNDFIVRQRGMFSFTGLSKEQVLRLRDEHSIYMVASGRISVAGLNRGNIDHFCGSVAKVLET